MAAKRLSNVSIIALQCLIKDFTVYLPSEVDNISLGFNDLSSNRSFIITLFNPPPYKSIGSYSPLKTSKGFNISGLFAKSSISIKTLFPNFMYILKITTARSFKFSRATLLTYMSSHDLLEEVTYEPLIFTPDFSQYVFAV